MQYPAPSLPARLRAFTLIELLTVIAIVGILAAITIATVGQARSRANQVRCLSNIRQLGLAIIAYTQDNRDLLPHNSQVTATAKYTRTGTRSLGHHLASYLDQRRIETLGNDEAWLDYLLCPQRLAANESDTSAHFVVQCTMASTRRYSNGTNRPFGTDSAGPIRYGEFQGFGGPAQVWALMEADQQINGTGWGSITGSGWFTSLPAAPIHGASRVVLFFDGSSRLMKDLPPRPE